MLDSLDRKLLTLLQKDNRASLGDLARIVGSSRSAVARRLRRLRAEGVIRSDVAVVDRQRLGSLETFVIQMEVRRESGRMASDFTAQMLELPEVQQCYLTTGTTNCVLIVLVWGSAQLEEFVEEHLVDNPFVREFTTSLVTRDIKVGLGVPILPADDDG